MKALVRRLTLVKGHQTECHNLVYLEQTEKGVKITPFDFERAGYEYFESLTITLY